MRCFLLGVIIILAIAAPAAAAPPYLGEQFGPDVDADAVGGAGIVDLLEHPAYAPVLTTGNARVVVLMVNFPDEAGDTVAHDTAYFNTFFFTDAFGDLNNFLKEISYNQFSIEGYTDTAGWRTSVNNEAYWGADGGGVDNANDQIANLAKEAVLAADTDIDFSQFDNNGDGDVDFVFIIHAGAAQEKSAAAGDIYSHNGTIAGGVSVDGCTVSNYVMVSEESPLGIVAHEFCHALGLPDLYHTGTGVPTVGKWDLMDQGAWAGFPAGSNPAHPSAWCKALLGWVTPVELTANSFADSLTPWALAGDVVKMKVTDTEYFLIENRRKLGYETWLSGEGLLIWHIDDAIGDIAANNINNGAIRRVELLEADNVESVNGDVGDPWPGTTGFTFISDTTTPSLKRNDGGGSSFQILNIVFVGDTGAADFIVKDPSLPRLVVNTPIPGSCTRAAQTVTGYVTDNAETPAYLNLTLNSNNYVVPVTTAGGTFSQAVTLDTGYNGFNLSATDSAGNSADQSWGMLLADSLAASPTGDSAGFSMDITTGAAFVIPQGAADTTVLTMAVGSSTVILTIDWADTGYAALARLPSAAEQTYLSAAANRGEVVDYDAGDSNIFVMEVTGDSGLLVGDSIAPYDGITLTFNYRYAEMLESNLGIYYFDPSDSTWQDVLNVAGLALAWEDGSAASLRQDREHDTISVRVSHLSIYGVFPALSGVSANLDNVIIFPNPYKPYDGNPQTGTPFDGNTGSATGIRISGLTDNTTITVYTMNGERICELRNLSGTGMAVWDGENDNADELRSGIYYLVIDNGKQKVIKAVAIIR